ncbi:15287_t:CDS:2 [Gigaspora margarita]|uniref:15287_t:CDS:1 n=1 Tax=Gigaspora margarita TaxID=4874 RepID=A0ABN7UKJ8_GIGMA|nr:15287_t:CDS:2 [Gigaspora margarita]
MALHKERVLQEKAEKALYKKRNIQGTQMEEKYTQWGGVLVVFGGSGGEVLVVSGGSSGRVLVVSGFLVLKW